MAFRARHGESKSASKQRAARYGIAMGGGANVNRSAGGSGSGGGSGASSAESKARQKAQQDWLDKSGSTADKQVGVGDKMNERADRIGNRDIAAGEASSEVAQSYDGAQGQMNRNLSRYGANPNSGRFAHGQKTMANARAAADAGARTKARRNADKDSMQAYGQTQNAYSQAEQSNFGVYDRYDKWNTEDGADQNYNSPSGSSFGGSTIGGRQRLGKKRVDHNALSRNRTHVTFNKNNPTQQNEDNSRFLGPDNLDTPFNPDNNTNSPWWDGNGGTEQGQTRQSGNNVNYFDDYNFSGAQQAPSSGGWNDIWNNVNDSIRQGDQNGGYGYNSEVMY